MNRVLLSNHSRSGGTFPTDGYYMGVVVVAAAGRLAFGRRALSASPD